jgi:hypothetical protein
VGITGLPTVLSTLTPPTISHTEVLPDGRTLQVRASVTVLTVSWGDGASSPHDPKKATPYPSGQVTHTYTLKTCTAEYRDTHPSGGLCHPFLSAYTIDATFRWTGSYNVGTGWVDLGTLQRPTSLAYPVKEARGVPVG